MYTNLKSCTLTIGVKTRLIQDKLEKTRKNVVRTTITKLKNNVWLPYRSQNANIFFFYFAWHHYH